MVWSEVTGESFRLSLSTGRKVAAPGAASEKRWQMEKPDAELGQNSMENEAVS